MTMPDDDPNSLPEVDARAMVRLLADVVATPGGYDEKKRTLMSKLCELVGADYWVWGLVTDYDPDKPAVSTSFITGGFREEQIPKLVTALGSRKLEDVLRPLGREIKSTNRQVTRLPSHYDPDNALGKEDITKLWKDADISSPMLCYRPVSNNCLSGIGIYRRFDSPPFTERDVRIAHIIMTEVVWLHEQGWPWESALRVPELPNRCRLALNLLLEGLPRQKIADEMNLSIHTTNEYIKRIYTFYSVHSHAELLNRFRAWQDTPDPL